MNSSPRTAWLSLVRRIQYLSRSLRWRVVRNGVLAGLLAGAVTIAYRIMIGEGTEFARMMYQFLRNHPIWIIGFLAVAVVGSFVIWALLRWEPDAAGSGIPQVKGVMQGKMLLRPIRTISVRFLGGGIGSVFGLSLGREGPSIHIGAATADLLAKPLKASAEEEQQLLTSGAAAGLSAAFNAPVSGLVFGIEGLHRSFSPLAIASAATGALAADVVSAFFFGFDPILQFGDIYDGGTSYLPLTLLWVVIPLGILMGFAGAIFNKLLLASQNLQKLPGPLPIFVALLVALICGIFAPQLLGGGENLIEWSQFEASGLALVALLICGKAVFTAISFGSGTPGGIFMPILALGTLCGAAYSIFATGLGLPNQYQATLAVCAMGGMLAASVRTPLTSILLTAEMTGTLSHLLPVATVVIISVFVADALAVPPIYDSLLTRMLRKRSGSSGIGLAQD